MTRRHLLVFACIALVPVLIRLGGEAANAPPGAPPHPVEAPAAARATGLALPPDLPEEVPRFLETGQNWRAARAMRDYLGRRDEPDPAAVLLAARAEAGWGGWDNVRVLLEGEPWLDGLAAGEGWQLLGRALEEEREWEAAAAAYGRYLRAVDASPGDRRVVTELRRGLALLRLGRVEEGTAALERVREHDPAASGWAATLMAEALEARGDTARVRALLEGEAQGSPARMQRAWVRAHLAAGDARGARAVALGFRERSQDTPERAAFLLLAARAALEAGDTAAARGDLLAVVRGAPGSGSAPGAARLLRGVGGLGADDRLALARVDDRHGADARAAAGYGAWLDASPRAPIERRRELRLLQGRAWFDAGRYAEAEAALRRVDDAPAAVAAPALYLLGRAQQRRGAGREAQATLLRVAERFPRAPQAAEALFLVADLAHDAGETARTRTLYRRVAREHPGTERAGLSLMRLGGMAYLARDHAAAQAAWDEARRTFPSGAYGTQGAYWSGRALEARGDSAGAALRYREARRRDPLSYYALRAAERLGEPFWPIPLAEAPADDPAVRARVEGWLHTLDLLRAAGLHAEADAEADRLVARAGDDAALLYPLAERLAERGYTVHGISLGYRLQREAGGWNERLLRIVYPFPYREMIAAEARERGLDPFLVAALIRQESTFRARIASPVGARGLMQIMPETGRRIAYAAEIRQWDPEILYNPEINVHMGVRYLADQVRRYGGSLPSVFSAYNAGPARVERWKRFPEYRDEELFTERIPFAETRDYVKILTRNIAVYRGLYGE